ncbi:uncharacterized protein GGS22DRAFT_2448 [Annulohypoxylon maeteangense]|uniref:uncharacterized protein n=1 Tax=Annulohypoxylon maeteangense TaxID=1927788 RepID=UPI002007A7EB|nr:uncharacterized protein GGS22DRAFT_2448 [Annulohypoxylon maeteangense]KAI0889667.1 hypothetical protein GGS22DRAFT_2448 [Annulohypoxylon maeteangense]
MLPQRIARASALRSASLAARRLPIVQQRTFVPRSYSDPAVIEEKFPDNPKLTEAEDPGQNGGYINPPAIKRQFRDPHGDWWDKQERRNYGEPVHEDNDLLGIFSPYEYTWISPGKGLLQVGAFIATVVGVCWVVGRLYPDKPSYPREFEGGLDRELGGAGAWRARAPGDPEPYQVEEAEEE